MVYTVVSENAAKRKMKKIKVIILLIITTGLTLAGCKKNDCIKDTGRRIAFVLCNTNLYVDVTVKHMEILVVQNVKELLNIQKENVNEGLENNWTTNTFDHFDTDEL